jgi:peroxiredoxin
MSDLPAAPERARVGDSIPDLTLPALDGAEVALRALAGRRSVLFIWASW